MIAGGPAPGAGFRLTSSLRTANLAVFLLLLRGLRADGLLVSLTIPVAVLGLYIAANILLAWRTPSVPAPVRAALCAADILLIGWGASWTSAWGSGLLFLFLVPLTIGVMPHGTPTSLLLTAWAVGGAFLMEQREAGGFGPGFRLGIAALALVPWSARLLAASPAEGSRAARVNAVLHRTMLFHEFLSHILFQMREYLTSITTVSSHLAASVEEGPNRKFAQKLSTMIKELNGKIDRMFETVESRTTTRSKARPMDKGEAFFLEAALRESLAAALSAAPPPGPALRLWCDPNIPGLRVDRGVLITVFTAVLQNAIEALAGKGDAGKLNISARLAEDTVQLEVVDDGGGLSGADPGRLFQPLFTTKASTGHVGLGLSMSRRLLERIGGTLSVRGEGERALVRIEFPTEPRLPRIREEESTWARRRGSVDP